MSKRTTTAQSGFMTLEVLGALLVMALLLPALYTMWSNGTMEIKKRAAAQHFTTITEAVNSYGVLHRTALLAESTPTTGRSISLDDLKADNVLSHNVLPLNPWKQTYSIYSRQPSAGELQLIVLTKDGTSHDVKHPRFSSVIIPATAALASAGFIPTTATGSDQHLQGAYNAWRADLAAMHIPSPGAGHLGTIVTPSLNDTSHDFLHRIDVPGSPELNEMWTELDMTDRAIENVKEVRFVPHTITEMAEGSGLCLDANQEGRMFLHETQGLYICRQGRAENIADTGNATMPSNMTIAVHGDIITKPICAEATNTTPSIFLAPSLIAAGGVTPPMASVQTWATSLNDTEWQVHMRVLTSDGWVFPTEDYGRIWVTTACVR